MNRPHAVAKNLALLDKMVNIQEVKDNELAEKINAHEEIGGALRICVFEIAKNYLGELPDEYLAHLITARQTLPLAQDTPRRPIWRRMLLGHVKAHLAQDACSRWNEAWVCV